MLKTLSTADFFCPLTRAFFSVYFHESKMLFFRVASYDIDQSGTTADDFDPCGYVYFESPNPDVARTFVQAFNRIDASTWSDCHTILNDDIQVVDGPADDYSRIYSWADIQDDDMLCDEMFEVSPA